MNHSTKPTDQESRCSLWPHRIALLLAGVVFPLIWVGGLVTTYDAGMAVPNWPNTYNYNMFAYPIRDWFFGPWDLFVEHGHRLLGSLAGLVSIALVGVTFALDHRSWVRRWSILILVMVIAQGVLGGQRVVQNARILAFVHGCFGPLFFATVVAMCVITSRWWQRGAARLESRQMYSAPSMYGVSLAMLILSYAQLVLGAGLRHLGPDVDATVFPVLILWHVTVGVSLFILALAAVYLSRCPNLRWSGTRWTALVLLGLIIAQITLGATTYIFKFGWPAAFGDLPMAARFVVPEKTFWQMNIITLHVAVGSLILAIATVQWSAYLRAWWQSSSGTESAWTAPALAKIQTNS